MEFVAHSNGKFLKFRTDVSGTVSVVTQGNVKTSQIAFFGRKLISVKTLDNVFGFYIKVKAEI